ncbi:MAG TPA: hypothetical protein VGG70_05925 [Candidatus Cybelea sp.]
MSNPSNRLAPVIGACAAVAFLAACSGMQQGAGAPIPPTTQSTAATQTAAAAGASGEHPLASVDLLAKTLKSGKVPAQHRLSGKSWINPDLHKKALIYASDYPLGTVDIYDFAKPNHIVGQITGFDEPYGQCVDKAGDVYVVDFGTANLYEYAHGATSYFNVATDNYGYPIGCAVDPTSGDIAVTNFQGYNYTTGGVVVFAGGLRGTQKYYTQSSLYFAWPPGYDRNGNLFVEGSDFYQYYNAFGELPHHGKSLEILAGVSIGYPASVQGYGKTILAADQSYNGTLTTAIYNVSAFGSTATVTHTSVLTDDCFDGGSDIMGTAQPFAYNGRVVAGNGACADRFGYWNLTYGGNPFKTIPAGIAPKYAYGESVSP